METDKNHFEKDQGLKLLIPLCIFAAGALFGVATMFFVHSDALQHYNSCQEAELQIKLIEANTKLRQADETMSHSFTIGEAEELIRNKKKK